MTLEMLKEMASRIDRNNRQLMDDIATMQKEQTDCEKNVREKANECMDELLEILSLIPEYVTTNLRKTYVKTYDGRLREGDVFEYAYSTYRYKRFCCLYIILASIKRENGVWECRELERTSVEDLVKFVNYFRENKEAIMQDVADVIKAFNDKKLEEAHKVMNKTCEYKSASMEETDNE